MQVVMIDRNTVTDPRIVLEARALRAAGYQVELVACGPETGRDEIDGLPIQRFPASLGSSVSACVYQQREQIEISQERMERWHGGLKAWLGAKAARLLLLPVCPRAGMTYISERGLPRWLSMPSYVLCLLATLDARLILHTIKPGLLSLWTLIKNAASLFTQRRVRQLDSWERMVYQYVSRKKKVAVLQAHDLTALNVAVALKGYWHVPLIYDAHELYSYQPGIEPDRAALLRAQECALIQHVDQAIVICPEQSEIMARDFDYHRFTPVSNATDTPAGFDAGRPYDLIRARTGIPANDKIIFFQGNANRLRSIDVLIDGLALARSDVHAVFLSTGAEIPEFKEQARRLGVGGRVHFLPTVSSAEIHYWVASADAGIIPYQPHDMNTRISCPNKMYDFIAAGIPIIGNADLPNVKRVVGGVGFGVVRALVVAADYAAAINEMFDEGLGGAARFHENLRRERHRFVWACEERRFLGVFRTALENSNRPDRLSPVDSRPALTRAAS